MIPKVIHYCWFGRNPLPVSALKCIQSWKMFFPGYEIKEWNEDNFDVHSIPYTREAYQAKKYAFVSDYARFWILYHYGGLYFDTDVEIIRPMGDIIAQGPFMGKELDDFDLKVQAVNPGLCLGAVQGMEIYERMLNGYQELHFVLEDGSFNPFSMIPMLTQFLIEDGLKIGGGIQHIDGVNIYPPEYFNPWDDALGKLNKTEHTRAIHWYSKTWMNPEPQWKIWMKRLIRRVLGKQLLNYWKRK